MKQDHILATKQKKATTYVYIMFLVPIQDNLLLYNHARLMSQDNHSKDYLVSIMFSHYDKNNNGNLETTELNEVKRELIPFRAGPDVKSFFSFRPLSRWDSFCVIT